MANVQPDPWRALVSEQLTTQHAAIKAMNEHLMVLNKEVQQMKTFIDGLVVGAEFDAQKRQALIAAHEEMAKIRDEIKAEQESNDVSQQKP